MNKKLTGLVLDLFALVIWGFSSMMLYEGKIPFIWEGIAYYTCGLIVFTAEESTISHAVKKVINALIGKIHGTNDKSGLH